MKKTKLLILGTSVFVLSACGPQTAVDVPPTAQMGYADSMAADTNLKSAPTGAIQSLNSPRAQSPKQRTSPPSANTNNPSEQSFLAYRYTYGFT